MQRGIPINDFARWYISFGKHFSTTAMTYAKLKQVTRSVAKNGTHERFQWIVCVYRIFTFLIIYIIYITKKKKKISTPVVAAVAK